MIKSTLLLFLTFLITISSYATHNMGKDLQYECLGLVNGEIQYRVTVRFYRNCYDGGSSVAAPNSVSIEVLGLPCGFNLNTILPLDPNAIPANGTEITELCPAAIPQSGCNWVVNQAPPLYPGVQIYTYSGIVNIPANCDQITFGTTDCCRNGAIDNIANAGSSDLSIFATANNRVNPLTGLPYCNKSVTFTISPVPFYCLGSSVTYNPGAVDEDGDSLVYSIINPLDGNSLPFDTINFSNGWSVNNPVKTIPLNSFQFDPHTGQMNFTPGFVEQDVLAIQVKEYRNGVLIGTCMRDIQVVIIQANVSLPKQQGIINLQNGQLIDSIHITVCPNTPLSFDIKCIDPAENNLSITSNINNNPSAIPNATMQQLGSGDSIIARVNWTPLTSDLGCHQFTLKAKNDDCPINGSNTRVYSICVVNYVSLQASSPTFCGTPVQLITNGGSNFYWTPRTGLNSVSDSIIYNPTVSPVTDTKYYFSSDCGIDSVLITAAPFSYDAGTGGSICQKDSIFLLATADLLYPPYRFKWVPSEGLYNPINGIANDSIANPIASPDVTTNYKLFVTGTNGCKNVDSVLVEVQGNHSLSAYATPKNVCLGNVVKLNSIESPQSCEISQLECNGVHTAITIGTGNIITGTSVLNYPTIYGHYRKSARHQFLYLRSELLALLGSGGTIDSLFFDLAQINTQNDSMQNFEIKIACTSENSLTSWQTNLKTVFTAKTVSIGNTIGWKAHALDFAYNWDGKSNLVIDICFDNGLGGIQNNRMRATPTSFRSVYHSSSNISQCGSTGTPTFSFNRPNTRFSFCLNNVIGADILWSPTIGANAPIQPTIANPFATPDTSLFYKVTVSDSNGCTYVDSVLVTVDQPFNFEAGSGGNICLQDSIFLFATTDSLYAPYHFKWVPSAGLFNPINGIASDSIVNPIARPNVTTTYKLLVTGNNGCTNVDSVLITVAPPFIFDAGTGGSTCQQDSIFLFATTDSLYAPYHFKWVPSAGLFSPIDGVASDSIANPTASPNVTTTYKLLVTGNNGCTNVDSVLVLVKYSSVPILIDTFLIQGNSYELPSGVIVTQAGTYTDTLIASNLCDSIVVTNLDLISSVSELNNSLDFKVYPNPANGELFVETNGIAIKQINIYNSMGVLVSSHILSKSKSIFVGMLAAGVYVAEIKTYQESVKKRWIKL